MLHSHIRQKRGTVLTSSEVEVVGKPDKRKWRYSPTHIRGSRSALPLLSVLAVEISYVSTSQVGSITLLCQNESFSLSPANI